MAAGEQLPIEDEMAIRFMFSKYGHLLDGGDAKGWGDLFTDDGSWTRVNSPARDKGGSGLPAETVSGRSNLVQMAIDVVEGRFNGLCRHQMTDVHVSSGEDADTANGMARALITDWNDGPGKVAMVGNYKLVFSRTREGWRIRSIECTLVPA
jgi:hypothetical protein